MSRLSYIDITIKRIFLALWLILSGNTILFAQSSISQVVDLLLQADAQDKEGSGNDKNSAASLPAVDNPVVKIRKLGEGSQTYSFELKDADIRDVFKVLAYDHKLNLLVDKDVQGTITATMSEVSLGQFLDAVSKSLNLVIENNGDFSIVKPDLITRIFILKHIEASGVLNPSQGIEAQTTKRENTIYDLLSAKGKLLLGKQPNSIMVIDYSPNVKKIGDYLNEIDSRMSSQVFKLKYLKATDVVGAAFSTPQPGVPAASSAQAGLPPGYESQNVTNTTNTGG